MKEWHQKLTNRSAWYRNWHSGSLHHVLHWTAFVVVAGILSITISSQLTNEAVVDNVISKSNFSWISADQAARDGKVGSSEKLLELSFSYDIDTTPALKLSVASIKNGYVPTQIDSENNDLTVQILNAGGKVIGSQNFVIPNMVDDPPPLGRENGLDNQALLKKVSFVQTLGYVAGAKSIQVIDRETGAEVMKGDLGVLKDEGNKASYQSLPGESAKKPAGTSLRSTPLVASAFAAGTSLDITFIGDGYSTTADLDLFHSDVNNFIANILTYEPYKSRASQLFFHYVDNTASLGCAYDSQTARLLICNNSTVTQKVNSSGVPYDKIVVIVNNTTYGGSGGSIAVAYNGSSGAQVFVHEFGHSLPSLIDEYNLYAGNGSLDNKAHANCYAGTPPNSGWVASVATLDYTVGCNYPNWYRPAPGSVMISLGYHYFNSISQAMINNSLTLYSAAYADSSAPTSQIVSPLNAASVSGTVSVTTSLSDNAGIARAELWKDNILFRTSYVSPFSFSWPTTAETNESHTLVVKAFDVAGNITSSAPVVATVNNSADTTLPIATITSPSNNATISGLVSVNITATDNSGAVSKVELYKDGALLQTDTASPFTLTWNTIQETNGSHALQTKAYDPSGNIGVSSSVTVTVSNTTDTLAPTVILTKPLNGSTVPTKGSLKIAASATDASGIASIVLFIDGAAIKTCSAVTSCAGSVQVSGLSIGLHTISARATDTKGNTSDTRSIVTK